MAQKFIGIEDAASQLGVSKDVLTQLREAGKLRGYRDGASWKFRTDDIERIGRDGLPSAAESDIGLSLEDEPSADAEAASLELDELTASTPESSGKPEKKPTSDEMELDELELDGSAAISDFGIEELEEPTVPADDAQSEADDEAESILLSENEFGDSADRPPSTIIGKADLDPAISDLDLAVDSGVTPGGSDVRLATDAQESQVLSDSPESSKSQFQGIEELEIDLEAESSRIHSSDVADKARQAAKTDKAASGEGPSSDLQLEPSDSLLGLSSSSEIELGGEGGGGEGLTGISSLELEEDEDEDVLGDGSDITLSSQDSGINLVSPSDSGLALDSVPLELSGSSVGSSLDLGDAAEEDISLETLDSGDADEGEEDFLLTPVSEEAVDDEEESSSQVIALDEVDEQEGAEALLGGEDAGLLGEDYAAGGLAAAGVGTVTPVSTEDSFSLGSVLGLTGCVLLMCLAGMMMVDLVRNMWGWNEALSLNSSLIDSILSLF